MVYRFATCLHMLHVILFRHLSTHVTWYTVPPPVYTCYMMYRSATCLHMLHNVPFRHLSTYDTGITVSPTTYAGYMLYRFGTYWHRSCFILCHQLSTQIKSFIPLRHLSLMLRDIPLRHLSTHGTIIYAGHM